MESAAFKERAAELKTQSGFSSPKLWHLNADVPDGVEHKPTAQRKLGLNVG